MAIQTLYRSRIIPQETVRLKDDVIVFQDENLLITSWQTLKPKLAFHHGASCYFLRDGLKVSKFYREDGSLLYWYCDIVEYQDGPEAGSLVALDLLADVVIYPDGRVQVADLEEISTAFERGLISPSQLCTCLRRLDRLLNMIYQDKFDRFQAPLESLGL